MAVASQNPQSSSLTIRAHREGKNAVESVKSKVGSNRVAQRTVTRAPVIGLIKGIGAALIVAAMIIVVLSMVFELDIVADSEGPFADLIDDFITYGIAALSLVGVGIIILAAQFAINMFGTGGMGGR